MNIKEISRKEYDVYLDRLEGVSFLQTSEMAEVLKSNKRKTKLLALVDDDQILAVGLAFMRNFYGGERIDLMVGASAEEKENEYIFYDKLKDYAKEEGYLKLIVKLDEDYQKIDQDGKEVLEEDKSFFKKMTEVGYIENDGTIASFDGSPDYQFIKDLTDFLPDNENKLLKSFNKNAQRKIKKARELGIRVRKISKDEMDDFKRLTFETAERQGFGDKSLDYYQTFYDEFGEKTEFLTSEIDFDYSIEKVKKLLDSINDSPKNKQRRASLEKDIRMLEGFKKEADRDIVPLANMILVYGDDEVVYFLGGSLTEYQKLPGAFILQYEAMKRIMEKEIPIYNFFGVDGVFDGSDGVLRFKQNFNGYILRKTGAFIYYPDPARLEKEKNSKKKD